MDREGQVRDQLRHDQAARSVSLRTTSSALVVATLLLSGVVTPSSAQQPTSRTQPGPPSQRPPQAPLAQTQAPEPALSIGTGAPYVTPFPEGDVYKLALYGDGYAEGLLSGLIEAFANEPRVQIQRKHKALGALIRPEFEDEVRVEETARDIIHVAVLMFGQADRDRIRVGNQRLAVGTDEWQAEYGRRVDRLIRGLKKRNMALYIVGQPPLRQPSAQRDSEVINEILRERARANGVRFIDIAEGFLDESGTFSQFGPDLSGNRQKLRENDGATFTAIGNRKLAHFVDREVRRDVTQARSDRVVPLAGNEAEQKRINPQRSPQLASAQLSRPGALRSDQPKGAVDPGPGLPPGNGAGDQRADNGRIVVRSIVAGREETSQIDIVRPAIPAAVVQLVTRREVTEKLTQPGEVMLAETASGLMVVSSIGGLGDTPQGQGPQGQGFLGPQGQGVQRRNDRGGANVFYTVVVRGERLPPKPGRADDFTWPRPEAVAPTPVPVAAPVPATKAAPQRAPVTPSGQNAPRDGRQRP